MHLRIWLLLSCLCCISFFWSVRPASLSVPARFLYFAKKSFFFLLLSFLLFLSFSFFFILLVVLSLSLSFHQFREQRKNKNSSQVVPKTAFPVELSFNLEKREEMAFLAMPRKGNLLKSKVLPTARALKSNPLLTLMGKF